MILPGSPRALIINVIMKKLHIYLMAAFAAFAAISCQNEELVQTPESEENPGVQADPAVWTLTAGFKAEDGGSQIAPTSRTALEGTKVTWSVGDKINVNGVESLALTAADIEENAALAHFQFSEVPQGEELVAIYPASAYLGERDVTSTVTDPDTGDESEVTKHQVLVNFPSDQTYDPATQQVDPSAGILVGSGTGASCSFEHAVAYLRISCNQTVKSIRVRANAIQAASTGDWRAGMAMSGTRAIIRGSQYLTDNIMEDVGTSVTVDFGDSGSDQPVVIPVAARNYTRGLNFFVLTADGKYQYFKSESAVSLSAKLGKILDITLNLNALQT